MLWTGGTVDLQVTHDLGASWTARSLPEAQDQSLGGAGIDSAGTLFLLRGGALFSRQTY